MSYRLLADLVLVAHAAFVAFVVLGGLVVLRWPRVAWFHLPVVAWGAGIEVENRTLDRPITRLRRHLGEDARFPRLIRTIVGMGYRLEADVEKIL